MFAKNPFDKKNKNKKTAVDPANIEGTTAYHIKVISNANVLPEELIKQIEEELGLKETSVAPKDKEKEDKKNFKPKEKINFNFDMVSTSMDLKNLVEKLKKSKIKSYSLLLYGAPGCGKTLFGKYLAQELGMEVVKKSAADMLNRFVGESEKAIAAAFKEAVDKNAILILDECDSMLTDRSKARQDFQVSSVNTMLTCMENHPLPFICSTNLKDWLDRASMRRFVFKIKYDEMNHKNIKAGIKEYFGSKFDVTEKDTKELKHITAGDFPIVKKKLDILENGKYTKDNILSMLLEEQKEKEITDAAKVGF